MAMLPMSCEPRPVLTFSSQGAELHSQAGFNNASNARRLRELFGRTVTCFTVAMYRVMYSTVTGSSTVRRWLWHSILALLTMMRASAVSPAANEKENH